MNTSQNTYYSNEGNLKRVFISNNGKMVAEEWYDDGHLVQRNNYVNELEHGHHVIYFPNTFDQGHLDVVAEGEYVNGVKVGVWKYMDGGVIVSEGEHNDEGNLTGEWYFLDPKSKKEVGRAIYDNGEAVSGTGKYPTDFDTCDIIEYLGMAWY